MWIRVLFKCFCSIVVSATIAPYLLFGVAHAEIITDGSVGSALSVPGPDFVIPQSLGNTTGRNLFHSFQSFNIANSESATYTGANNIRNVISRVTGGQSSTIDGILRSEIGQANFFFLNPSGVIFGPNAAVDVPAAFHISTAANLRFGDGAVFSAIDPQASTLSMASPSDFGFVADRSSEIHVKGIVKGTERSELRFTPNTITSLSAGKIVIESGTLINEGGEIHVTAVGAMDTLVPIYFESFESVSGTGTIKIQNKSLIDASGNGAGRIVISGGDTEIVDSFVFADNSGNAMPDTDTGITIDVNSLLVNNSFITSNVVGTGDAGNVSVSVEETLNLTNGGNIHSKTFSGGNTANILVNSDQILVDGRGAGRTGILNSSSSNSTGNTGIISVNVNGGLSLLNGGLIQNDALGEGRSGDISVSVEKLIINRQGNSTLVTGISSFSSSKSLENSGTITVTVNGKLLISNGGEISNDTFGKANAGMIIVNAGDILINAENKGLITGIHTDTKSGSSGNAGVIMVVADDLLIVSGGSISSGAFFGEGNAGNVNVAAKRIRIDGKKATSVTGIFSNGGNGSNSNGNAGSVDVSAVNQLLILGGGSISSSANKGNAGIVSLSAEQLIIDAENEKNNVLTGVFTDVGTGTINTSGTGSIDVIVGNELSIINGGTIRSITFGENNAGNINIAANQIVIDRQDNFFPTGVFSDADIESIGNAGAIVLNSSDLHIINGGQIAAETSGMGKGGNVTINAREILIDSSGISRFTGISADSNSDSFGNAGMITLNVGILSITGGGITTNTLSQKNAGNIVVNAGNIVIDGQGARLTGISSAGLESSGNAGTVTIFSDNELSLVNGGIIVTSTVADGDAGDIEVHASQLIIDGLDGLLTGILSTAEDGSSGQTGNVALHTKNLSISNGGTISIQSNPSVNTDLPPKINPTEINIKARNITLDNNATITAQSEGNVPASSIIVNATNQLNVNGAKISTAANQANGGSITINGGNAILTNSQLTTSVAGNGNGGDITLNPAVLVLNSGFIQANTSGKDATGGEIKVNSEVLISSNNQLEKGGDTPIPFQPGLNVIQAAAQAGVSGNIDIASPELNISGSLANLDTQLINIDSLSKNSCANPTLKQSILTSIRKGGLPTSVEQSLSVPLNSLRLQKMLHQSVLNQRNTLSPQTRSSFADAPCF